MKMIPKTLAACAIAATLAGCATIKHVGDFIKPPVKFKPAQMVRGKQYMINFSAINQYPDIRPAMFSTVRNYGKYKGWYVFCRKQVCFLVPQLSVMGVEK